MLPGQGTGLSALPGMQPPKGLNVETLFAEDIQDPMARIKRLENVVLDMRRDLNAALPSIVRLVAVEQDMQNLIGQLETLVEQPSAVSAAEIVGDSAPTEEAAPGEEDLSGSTQQTLAPQAGLTQGPAPPPGAPSDIPAEETEEKAQAPPSTGPPEAESGPAVEETPSVAAPVFGAVRLRAEDRGGKTRLVLETGGTSAFRVDLDNAEKLLVVELPEAEGSGGEGREAFAAVPLVAGWSVQAMEGGGGVRAIVELSAPVRVARTAAVPGQDGASARIILDLEAGRKE